MMKRIFIAVKVVAGPSLLKMISSFRAGLPNEGIKWVNPDNLHITLAFPGNTHDERIEAIDTVLKEICGKSERFEVLIRGAGLFKNPADPRIIWAGINKSEELSELGNSVIKVLRDIDIELETRPFNPHLTFGRIKYLTDKEELRNLISMYSNADIQIVPVKDVILYESILLPSGPVYKPVGNYLLL